MTRSHRRKSTAAYAASQPLFDALKDGCERLVEQEAALAAARDLVQTLHVKLPNAIDQEESKKHERYINNIVEAYTAAVDVYVDILNALTAVTAADASEGRQQRDGHEAFQAMVEAASVAQTVAKSYKPAYKVELGVNEQPLSHKLRETLSATPSTATRSNGNLGTDEGATGIRYPRKRTLNGPVNNTEAFDDSLQRAKKMLKLSTLDERDIQDQSLPSSAYRPGAGRESTDPQQNVNPSSVNPRHREPGVEYEDISAEVDARLKKKEEKRKAKSKEKKRKRRSDQSVPGVEDEEKLEKKKSKSVASLQAPHGGAAAKNVGKSGKRKEPRDSNDYSHKKRKKF